MTGEENVKEFGDLIIELAAAVVKAKESQRVYADQAIAACAYIIGTIYVSSLGQIPEDDLDDIVGKFIQEGISTGSKVALHLSRREGTA